MGKSDQDFFHASSHLYERVCPTVRLPASSSIRLSVGPSYGLFISSPVHRSPVPTPFFWKTRKTDILSISFPFRIPLSFSYSLSLSSAFSLSVSLFPFLIPFPFLFLLLFPFPFSSFPLPCPWNPTIFFPTLLRLRLVLIAIIPMPWKMDRAPFDGLVQFNL